MTTAAQFVKYRRQMAKLEANKRTPDKVPMRPREKIRIKRRCNLCGRARAVYRKFGICRICFRGLASDGLIPGVRKASWEATGWSTAPPLLAERIAGHPEAMSAEQPAACR
jgi:small subunit ribosomal protein S14